ncbi:hypothetical protein CHH58_05135 [Terribacillus saccharophilus]|nr:hypothetical protein CHH58_05135 [Terribacillus saccharophilus]
MRYKLIETQKEYNDFLLKIYDLKNELQFNYYLSELPHVKLPQFKSFILFHLKDIRNGVYEKAAP